MSATPAPRRAAPSRAVAAALAIALPVALPLVAPARAVAQPIDPGDDLCWQSQLDPVPTPLRDGELDEQVGGCLRDEAGLRAVVVRGPAAAPGRAVDGTLDLRGRLVLTPGLEVGGGLRALDARLAGGDGRGASYGPVVGHVSAARALGRGLVFGRLDAEAPATREDTATLHLAAAAMAGYSRMVGARFALHLRVGGVAARVSAQRGDAAVARQAMARAGADLAWWARPSFALHAGVELRTGWSGGFDGALARLAVHGRLRGGWRAQAALGLPVGGREPATATMTGAFLRDLD